MNKKELNKVLGSPQWSKLPATKRQALALLLNDVDVTADQVMTVIAVIFRG